MENDRNERKNKWIMGSVLVGIFCLAAFFRFYKLSSVPPSASLDEASIGYNAYSIMRTGKDEYGSVFPILLRAYDDYRPALYVYLVVPFISLFGLTAHAVRLPSGISSVGVVVLSYLIARELFPKKRSVWLVALLVSVTPLAIYISRLGHEVNLGVFLATLGLYGSLYVLRTKKYTYLYGVFSVFSATLYTYQSYKLFTPLIVATITGLLWRQVRKKRRLLLPLLLAFILVLPLIVASLTPEALLRIKGTSPFGGNPEYEVATSQKSPKRFFIAGRILIENFFSHTNPGWLFEGGTHDIHKTPGYGLFYPWEAAFLLLGIVILAIGPLAYSHKIFLGAWLIFSFIPGTVTNQAPHAMRLYAGLGILPEFLMFLGVTSIGTMLRKNILKNIVVGIVVVLLLFSAQRYARAYFSELPKYQSDSFQYALAQGLQFAIANQDAYEKIVVSNERNLYQSYMFYLFYSAYPPEKYLESGGTYSGGYGEPHSIADFEFRPINWRNEENKKEKILYIGNYGDFPPNWPTRFSGSNLDGTRAVQSVTRY